MEDIYRKMLDDFEKGQEREWKPPPVNHHYATLIRDYLQNKRYVEALGDGDSEDSFAESARRLDKYERSYWRRQKIKSVLHKFTWGIFQ
jgi:hypothetical protein